MNKQIEELVKIITCYEDCGNCDKCQFHGICAEESIAETIYAKGYRKASEGEWIDEYKGKYENALYKCSACGGRANIDWITSNWSLTPFCPHCGAKMDGKEQNQ